MYVRTRIANFKTILSMVCANAPCECEGIVAPATTGQSEAVEHGIDVETLHLFDPRTLTNGQPLAFCSATVSSMEQLLAPGCCM